MLTKDEFDRRYTPRFMSLPIVEQRRLLNLLKFWNKGGEITQSLLAGFPKESISLLRDILNDGTG